MFERFTDRARRVIVLAQEEARGLDQNYIGTEHILLGLIAEGEGVASHALASCGVTLEGVRTAVEERIGRGTERPKGHIPFTPRAKKVLEFSLRQAIKLGHDYIGTEHVLLGLLDEGEGVAAQILMTSVEGGLDAVHGAVTDRLIDLGTATRSAVDVARERLQRSSFSLASNDEVIKRLEAIEARLSAIERLLRDQRGEESA